MNSVCVVGHGPSLTGANKGKDIDKHEVVRIKTGPGLLGNPDYGSRMDYLCSSTEVPGTFKGSFAKEYWAYPKRGYYDEGVIKVVAETLPNPIIVELNLINTWNAWFRGLGAKHPNVSTGMAAIIYSAHRLRPKEIILAGFDTLLNPSLPFTRITEIPRTGVGPFPNHDWEVENKLLSLIEHAYELEIHDLCNDIQ